MTARLVEAFADEMLRPGNLRLATWMKQLGGLEVQDEGSKIDYDKLLRYAWWPEEFHIFSEFQVFWLLPWDVLWSGGNDSRRMIQTFVGW